MNANDKPSHGGYPEPAAIKVRCQRHREPCCFERDDKPFSDECWKLGSCQADRKEAAQRRCSRPGACTWPRCSCEPAAQVVVEAFQKADAAMFSLLENEGVAGDEHRTVFGLVNESGSEVNSLEGASETLQEAVEWLQRRGYVEIGTDGSGEHVQVLARPEDSDGFKGVPPEAYTPPAQRSDALPEPRIVLPQAFFDEFGQDASDKVQDFARACVLADRATWR